MKNARKVKLFNKKIKHRVVFQERNQWKGHMERRAYLPDFDLGYVEKYEICIRKNR